MDEGTEGNICNARLRHDMPACWTAKRDRGDISNTTSIMAKIAKKLSLLSFFSSGFFPMLD